MCRFLVVDAYFAKQEFIDRITKQTGVDIITRLRCDANCKYLYKGPKSVGKEFPKNMMVKLIGTTPTYHLFFIVEDVFSGVNCRSLVLNTIFCMVMRVF